VPQRTRRSWARDGHRQSFVAVELESDLPADHVHDLVLLAMDVQRWAESPRRGELDGVHAGCGPVAIALDRGEMVEEVEVRSRLCGSQRRAQVGGCGGPPHIAAGMFAELVVG
jgi:hypothetical protein